MNQTPPSFFYFDFGPPKPQEKSNKPKIQEFYDFWDFFFIDIFGQRDYAMCLGLVFAI